MRVLTIGNLYPPAGGGGYERIWVAVVDALRAAGHEVAVLTGDAPAPGAGEEPLVSRSLRMYWSDGEWLRPGPLESFRIERHNARTLARALPGVDAVCFFNLGGLSMSLVRRAANGRIRAVGVVGDGWMAYGPRHDRWGGRPRLRGVRWLFISRWVAERSGFPHGEVVHPGIDGTRFPAVAPAPWRWRLACVGRVERVKGCHVARDALDGLPAAATLLLDGPAGDPGYLAELLGPRVTHRVGDPAAAYAEADAVLFPVEWEEPWGLVPLEAMAVGRPVVATASGGAAEYLRDGENCLVVPAGDASALAAAVRRLAVDGDLRARIVAGGRATAARHPQAAFTDAVVAAIEGRRGALPG